MPFLNTSGIRRTPNLKRMQLEKERLSMVDTENARLLAQIKKLKGRPARAFTRSSAAEDVLPLVLQRRKRERVRKARLVCKENERLKRRIDKIKEGGVPQSARPCARLGAPLGTPSAEPEKSGLGTTMASTSSSIQETRTGWGSAPCGGNWSTVLGCGFQRTLRGAAQSPSVWLLSGRPCYPQGLAKTTFGWPSTAPFGSKRTTWARGPRSAGT